MYNARYQALLESRPIKMKFIGFRTKTCESVTGLNPEPIQDPIPSSLNTWSVINGAEI